MISALRPRSERASRRMVFLIDKYSATFPNEPLPLDPAKVFKMGLRDWPLATKRNAARGRFCDGSFVVPYGTGTWKIRKGVKCEQTLQRLRR